MMFCSSLKMASYCVIVGAVLVMTVSGAWGGGDKIRLEDVNVLTLHNGKMTTGRRSAPMPQLTCVGGSAKGMFVPQTVQCYNRGSDGYDIQWECKTDMDNNYRFGTVEVVCEGYDYPDDPYILKGSCGLEYTLELTEEGRQKKHGHGGYHSNYDQSYHHHGSDHYQGYGKKASSIFGDLIFLFVIAGLVYFIYKKCIATEVHSDDAPPPYDGHQRRDYPGSQPPPYGFRQDYMPNNDSCSGSQTYTGAGQTGSQTQGPSTGGGFWSGAATGGLLGYLFGSRTNTYHHHRPYTGWGWGNGWGSGWGNRNTGWGSGWGSGWNSGHTTTRTTSSGWGGSSSSSSGTRTASGFGGTRRR